MVLTRDISEMNAGDHHRCCWRKRSLYSAPLPGRLTHWLKLCKALLLITSCVTSEPLYLGRVCHSQVLKSTLARTPERACDGAVSPLDGAAAPEQEAVALKPEPPQAPAPPHPPLLPAKRACSSVRPSAAPRLISLLSRPLLLLRPAAKRGIFGLWTGRSGRRLGGDRRSSARLGGENPDGGPQCARSLPQASGPTPAFSPGKWTASPAVWVSPAAARAPSGALSPVRAAAGWREPHAPVAALHVSLVYLSESMHRPSGICRATKPTASSEGGSAEPDLLQETS